VARQLDPARLDARNAGARFFISATPCKFGHPAGERYTSTGACRQCVSGQARDRRRVAEAVTPPDPMAAVLG